MKTIYNIDSVIGWLSALLIVIAYFLLSFGVLKSSDYYYNLLNLFGGIGLAYRVYLDKNWSNLTLEIVFILIALKSLVC
jgi:hypothetical protein